MTSVMSVETPISHLDPYSDRALIDPWPTYGELQDAGPAVWLSKYQMFALTRYDSALKALHDPSSFPSSLGVMMNGHMNHVLRGNTLCSDGEDHRRLRRIIMKPLTPSALKLLQERVTVEADELVLRPPTPQDMQRLLDLAAQHNYWMASPQENAAIGLSGF